MAVLLPVTAVGPATFAATLVNVVAVPAAIVVVPVVVIAPAVYVTLVEVDEAVESVNVVDVAFADHVDLLPRESDTDTLPNEPLTLPAPEAALVNAADGCTVNDKVPAATANVVEVSPAAADAGNTPTSDNTTAPTATPTRETSRLSMQCERLRSDTAGKD